MPWGITRNGGLIETRVPPVDFPERDVLPEARCKTRELTPANRSILPKCRKRPQQIGAPCQTAGNDLSKSESKRAESLKSKHLGMADSRLSCSLSMHPSCEQSWVEIQLDRQSRKLGPARWWIPVLCTIYCIRVRQRPRRTDARKQEEGVLRWA